MYRNTVIVFCICTFAVASAGYAFQEGQPSSGHSIEDVAWLTGSWTGSQGKAATEEHWIEPKGGMMLAINRTSIGDKGSFEFLRIAQKGKSLSYFASPSGGKAVEFTLKELKDQRVVFENLKHDFPQRIIYKRIGDELHGQIEGEAEGQMRTVKWTWKLTR